MTDDLFIPLDISTWARYVTDVSMGALSPCGAAGADVTEFNCTSSP